MSTTSQRQFPLSKKQSMVVEPMADEVLIYDTAKNKLHVLSPVAAAVWQHCDGQTTIPAMAAKLTVSTDSQNKENIVWLALEELEKSGLLQTRLSLPSDQLSRRAMLRKAAVATALALPFISTLTAPSPAHAQSVGGGAGGNAGGCQGQGGGNCGNGNGGGGGNGTGNEGNGNGNGNGGGS
jgi:hypothetical protein